jgi:hypothetical protein
MIEQKDISQAIGNELPLSLGNIGISPEISKTASPVKQTGRHNTGASPLIGTDYEGKDYMNGTTDAQSSFPINDLAWLCNWGQKETYELNHTAVQRRSPTGQILNIQSDMETR